MTTWSSEEVIDATITTLSSMLGPRLDAIYAAKADVDAAAGRTINYKAPKPGLRENGGSYYPDGASTILEYPAVEVSVPDLNLTNFDLGLDADATENLVVLFWEQDVSSNLTVLARKLRRLTAAGFDVLAQPGAISGATIQSVRAAWRWSPEAGERDEIESGGLLVFGLESTRARP